MGSGLCPRCPGTMGSLAALAVWLIAHYFLAVQSYLLDALCLAATVTIGHRAVRVYLMGPESSRSRRPGDPPEIVIDEWAGAFIALFGLYPASPGVIFSAFALFRFFDIIKPYPVSRLEHIPGATGIMADDLLAGVFARVCLSAGLMLYEFFCS